MNEKLKRCPVCGCKGTYERHEDGWATCSNCGMEANKEAADVLEEICTHRFEAQPDEAERTCRDIGDKDTGWFKCSHCGASLSADCIDGFTPDIHIKVNEDYAKVRYCPYCRTKVVGK